MEGKGTAADHDNPGIKGGRGVKSLSAGSALRRVSVVVGVGVGSVLDFSSFTTGPGVGVKASGCSGGLREAGD